MKTQTAKPEYLLVGRGTHWDKGLSPAEIKELLSRANAWFERLRHEGKAEGGHRLVHAGKIVSGAKGGTVTDGPFAESKEAIAGYILVQVDDLDEAVRIAKERPLLEIHGVSLEVRPVAE
jgi:hypothetical protein